MAEAAEKFEELIVPEGGIADFVGTEEEVEAMEAEDAKKEFGEAGIAEFSDVAKRMAGYGRFGDDTLAHVETGELIIPRALIEGNEKLREDIFNNLREQGVEDPERYVVGSEANSLNPDTGLPEFFFKKLFKGISKAFKGVVKVFKKIAPIVLPMVLGPAGLGLSAITAGALGSGIATLMNGGDFGDALKAGLTGGLMGAASSFGSGFLKGFQKGGFQGGLSGGIGSLKASVGSMFGGARTPAPVEYKGAGTSAGAGAGADTAVSATSGASATPATPATPATSGASATPTDVASAATNPTTTVTTTADVASDAITTAPKPIKPDLSTFSSNVPVTSKAPVTSGDGFFSKAQNLFFPDPSTDPSFLRKYGPLAVAGLGVAGAAGGFERPKFEPELPEGFELTGAQLYEQNPEQYTPRIDYGPAPNISDVRTESRFGDVVSTAPQSFYQPYPFTRPEGEGSVFDRPMITMAEGGEVFPRRNGGIMPNEGTPGEDSVRAMLMPGEFVMTTDAVRGAGNGNLNKGINNMYSVMRNLESRGRAS